MAIGKPLLVSERKGVAQPVLSAQTQQLSSNVPVQKIAMADYSIGMNNAMSSFAVTKELVNMVDAGVKAKMYIDQTKQQYARLNLMEDWQKTDNDFRTAFAKAITPEEQQAVKNDFAESMQTRTTNYRKGGGLGLPTSDSVQAQRDLSSLRAQSNKLFSKMDTTIAANINNRTNIMLGSRNKALIKEATENKNSDTVSILNDLKSNYEQQVSVGGLLPEQAVWNLEVATDKIVTGRGNLFATDFAKQATATGQYPTDKEFKAQIEGVMGMPLGERRLKLLKESFTDAYYKEISERNRQVKAEETHALEITEQGRIALKDKVNKALQDKTIAPELKTKLITEAHTFDFAVPGFGAKIEKQIMDSEYGASYKPFVEHFTTGEGRNVILENIKADGTSYFNLDELRTHLETMGGKYEGMNESTIREVLTHWRGVNDSTRKGLFTQGEEAMQTALMSMIKTDQSQVPEWLQEATIKRLGVTGPMLTNMRDPMHLNWSKTMRYSPAHAKAWNVTVSDIKAEFDSKLGVFSKENISQPSDVQRSMLETYVGKLLEKNFSESVNEELSRLDNEKLKKREKLETEQRNKKAQVEKELPTFAMEKIGDGVSPDEPTPKEVPPNVKLIEHQMSKKRARNAQSASTFKDQLAKGEYGSAVGTAVASKWTDITQGLRDAHEQSKLSYSQSTMNKRSQHIKDMAVMSKNVKETFSGGIWDKLANAVGQGEPITIEGFANDMGLLTSAIGDLLIDGVENHNIEKTPITDTKRTRIKTPDPLATPPEVPVVPDVSSATTPINLNQQAQAVPDLLEPSLVQQVMTAAAPIADAVFGGSPVSAEPRKFTELPAETQALTEQFQYVSPEDAVKSIQRNNPFNVEHSKIDWDGQVESDSQRFMATDNPLHGLRAGYINFLAKLKRGETVAQMIETISPRADKNPTDSMVKVASAMADVNPDETLEVSMDNFDKIKQLGLGLLRFEAPGHNYPDRLIDEAVKLAIEQKTGKSTSQKTVNYPPKKGAWSKTWKKAATKLPNTPEIQAGLKTVQEVEEATTWLQFDAAEAATKHIMASLFEKSGLSVPKIFTKTITEKTLSPEVVKAGGLIAYKAYIEGRGTDYKDMGRAKNLVYRKNRKKGIIAPALEMAKSFGDAATTFALTVGESSGVVVKKGNLYIKGDVYDFPNNFTLEGKNANDGWLWLQKKMALLNLSDKNSQKIEINLGKVADIKKRYEAQQRT